jgi:RNA polymerase sigma-70 factor (ECF subfamily)
MLNIDFGGNSMLMLYLDLIDNEDDKGKFLQIYDAYGKTMYYVANSILHDSFLAEDAVQTSFVKIAKNIHKFYSPICPQTKSFVVIIVRNVCFTMLTKENKLAQEELTDELACQGTPESDYLNKTAMEQLITAIQTLNPIYRDIITLKYLHDLSVNDITSLLDLSRETVKKRLQRGRILLKVAFEKE